jgi:hypothetical protein
MRGSDSFRAEAVKMPMQSRPDILRLAASANYFRQSLRRDGYQVDEQTG